MAPTEVYFTYYLNPEVVRTIRNKYIQLSQTSPETQSWHATTVQEAAPVVIVFIIIPPFLKT